MLNDVEIRPINPGTPQLEKLAIEARNSGYTFVDRLIHEAKSGQNCFNNAGEIFCGVYYQGSLVGCGGINQDPYTDQEVGRLRHVYILARVRRNGLAKLLVDELLKRSTGAFPAIRLRTSNENADKFYEAIGFARTDVADATHIIEF